VNVLDEAGSGVLDEAGSPILDESGQQATADGGGNIMPRRRIRRARAREPVMMPPSALRIPASTTVSR
jgi:hypothetical protein